MTADDKDDEKKSEPISYGFVRNAHWWYAIAWFALLLSVLHRWDRTGF